MGLLFFFFFQAEDGIRDADVTGVQTCALPIYRDDLSPLVEPAVGADLMRRLGLAALGAGGPGRRRHLVVRPALAAAGLGMTSFGQGHRSTPILLRVISTGARPMP